MFRPDVNFMVGELHGPCDQVTITFHGNHCTLRLFGRVLCPVRVRSVPRKTALLYRPFLGDKCFHINTNAGLKHAHCVWIFYWGGGAVGVGGGGSMTIGENHTEAFPFGAFLVANVSGDK